MKNCKESIDVLRQYLDGELPPEDVASLEAHFSCCPPCVEFLRSYRSTADVCRRALTEKLPDGVAAGLEAFLRERLKK